MIQLSLYVVALSLLLSLASSTPLLAYSYPKPFPGLESNFTQSAGTHVIFLPSFHPCGTLQIISVNGLLLSDFNLLSTTTDSGEKSGGKIKNYYNFAEDKVIEDDANEEGIIAWAKGWKSTCGKGEGNREVRFGKIDGVLNKGQLEGSSERESSIPELVYLAALVPPQLVPHNHVMILTTLSPSAALTLFDVVSSHPPTTEMDPSDGTLIIGVPRRRRRSKAFFSSFFGFAFKVIILCSVAYFGAKWWRKKQLLSRRKGVMLPLRSDDELELDLEAE